MIRYSRPVPVRQHDSEVPVQRRRATALASEGRLMLADGTTNSRLFVYMTGNYLHRMERARAEIYFGDLDLARVAEIIGTAGVEPGMRDAAFRDQHRSFTSVVGVAGQRAMNATSIASACGMPRETVRRKLKRLVELGFIIGKGRAHYVLKPGMLQDPKRQQAFARGIQQTVQFMNECVEQGLVRWVGTASKRRPASRQAAGAGEAKIS